MTLIRQERRPVREEPAQISADVLTGTVTFTDHMTLEITFGSSFNPDGLLHLEGNPLGLKRGDEVIMKLRRRE